MPYPRRVVRRATRRYNAATSPAAQDIYSQARSTVQQRQPTEQQNYEHFRSVVQPYVQQGVGQVNQGIDQAQAAVAQIQPLVRAGVDQWQQSFGQRAAGAVPQMMNLQQGMHGPQAFANAAQYLQQLQAQEELQRRLLLGSTMPVPPHLMHGTKVAF